MPEKSNPVVPLHPLREKQTVVTPYIYELFKDMYIGQYLKAVVPSSDNSLLSSQSLPSDQSKREIRTQVSGKVKPGDVIKVYADPPKYTR